MPPSASIGPIVIGGWFTGAPSTIMPLPGALVKSLNAFSPALAPSASLRAFSVW
jgi:hypothetical protein